MIVYGEYSSIDPWIENGKFEYYNEHGKLYSIGNYKDGLMSGNWIYYKNGGTDSINYDHVDQMLKKTAKTENEIHSNAQISKELYAYIYKNLHFPPRIREFCKFSQVTVLLSIGNDNKMVPEIIDSKYRDFNYEILRILLDAPDSIVRTLPRNAPVTNIIFNVTFDLANVSDLQLDRFQPDTTSEIFIHPTEEASFQGGDIMHFREYVQKNLVYPPEAVEKGQFGRVEVQFTVDKEGLVGNIKIMRSTGSKALDKEAVRVISNSPKWIPAKNNHIIIRQQITIPVIYMLQ